MNTSERALQQAEAMVALEIETGIARISEALAEQGEDVCVVCDEPIEAARKAALPSAERCIICQTMFERAKP